jgi:integrase
MRDEDGKQKYRALGQATDKFDYPEAKKAAESWFHDSSHGIGQDGPCTVADACKAYVEELDADGRLAAAQDARKRFERHVYDHLLGRTVLERLRTEKLKEWRNGLGGAKASQNRNWTSLRAALNLAVERRRVNAAIAIQWRAVKQHKGANGRREVFLDLRQRRALIAECMGRLRELVELAALTGARPGELASARRSAFDHRTGTLKLSGKTGTRTVPLAPAAIELCKRLAKDKLPEAWLLTRDDGEPWRRWDWDGPLREAREAAKLPSGVVLYTLRHSWITEALRSGMSTLDVARLTGTSLQMIEEHYGHLVADSARERLAAVTLL